MATGIAAGCPWTKAYGVSASRGYSSSLYQYGRSRPTISKDYSGLRDDPLTDEEKTDICNNSVSSNGTLYAEIMREFEKWCKPTQRDPRRINVIYRPCQDREPPLKGSAGCDENGAFNIVICTGQLPNPPGLTEHVRTVLRHELIHMRDACSCNDGCMIFNPDEDVEGVNPLERCKALLCSEVRAYCGDNSFDHLDPEARRAEIREQVRVYRFRPVCKDLDDEEFEALFDMCYVNAGEDLPDFPRGSL